MRRCTFFVDDNIRENLEREATRRNITMSEMARLCLRRWFSGDNRPDIDLSSPIVEDTNEPTPAPSILDHFSPEMRTSIEHIIDKAIVHGYAPTSKDLIELTWWFALNKRPYHFREEWVMGPYLFDDIDKEIIRLRARWLAKNEKQIYSQTTDN